MNKAEKENAVPVWNRALLTLEEAGAYTGIGVHKLRNMCDQEGCKFVIWVGAKRMIKRKQLDEFLDNSYSL